jgi:hypothetical protein
MYHRFPVLLLAAFLLISCYPSLATQSASPTSSPAPAPTLTPLPTSSPTPDPLQPIFDALQAEGINVSHEDGVWQLKIGELDVPGAFFDEDGEGLHITDGEKQIDIPVIVAAHRLEINADGLLLLNDGKGVNIGMFNPAAPEAGWMFFDYKMADPENESTMSIITLEDLSLGRLSSWERLNPSKINLPVDYSVDILSGKMGGEPDMTLQFISEHDSYMMSPYNIYKIPLDNWGVKETGFVITMEYIDKNKQPAYMHFIATESYVSWLKSIGFFNADGDQFMAPIARKLSFYREDEKKMFPSDRKDYLEMNDSFYSKLLDGSGLNPSKYPKQLIATIASQDVFPQEAQNMLWLPGWFR